MVNTLQNLTITLTLTCLSIIALAALTLLPITNGICEWTGDQHNKSYYNSSVDIEQEAKPNDYTNWSKDTQMGRGWSISASLNASGGGASASVSPSIYGLITFTEATTYGGTANVCASRSEVTISICPGCGNTHVLPGEVKSNQDEERTLGAKVVENGVEYWRMVGYEIDKRTGQKIEAGAEGKFNVKVVEVTVNTGYEWTGENGKKFKEESRTIITITELVIGDSQGQSVSVGPNNGPGLLGLPVPAKTGASLDFNFEGHSGGNSVSYKPPDNGSSN